MHLSACGSGTVRLFRRLPYSKAKPEMAETGKSVWLILIAVALMAYANLAIKARIVAIGANTSWWSFVWSMAFDPWAWSAGIAAVAAGLLYVLALRQLDLAVAQPLFALVFVVVPVAAAAILREPLTPLRVVGLLLIFVGVILVERTA